MPKVRISVIHLQSFFTMLFYCSVILLNYFENSILLNSRIEGNVYILAPSGKAHGRGGCQRDNFIYQTYRWCELNSECHHEG